MKDKIKSMIAKAEYKLQDAKDEVKGGSVCYALVVREQTLLINKLNELLKD